MSFIQTTRFLLALALCVLALIGVAMLGEIAVHALYNFLKFYGFKIRCIDVDASSCIHLLSFCLMALLFCIWVLLFVNFHEAELLFKVVLATIVACLLNAFLFFSLKYTGLICLYFRY